MQLKSTKTLLITGILLLSTIGKSQQIPRTYIAHKVEKTIKIDGRADESEWQKDGVKSLSTLRVKKHRNTRHVSKRCGTRNICITL